MTDDILTTRSGRQVHIRDLDPSDAHLLVELFYRLSPETRRRRFGTTLGAMPPEEVQMHAREIATMHRERQTALVVLHAGPAGIEAVAAARFVRVKRGHPEAELGVVVRDDYQRDGIGNELMQRLLARARRAGITALLANAQADNPAIDQMITRLRRQGYQVTSDIHQNERSIRIVLEQPQAG